MVMKKTREGTCSAEVLPTVVVIYCPLWHSYDLQSAWKGEGWCEWELLKSAPARFHGHHQPLQPTWGYFDESDPRWAAKEIDLAADHGIGVFLFDWYWYSGVKIMEAALERGFLEARNRMRLRFALMWANHDWADIFPAPYGKPWHCLLPSRHSARDLNRLMDYCAEHYFCQPNYWRLDGKLFFSVFLPMRLVEQLGGPAKTKRSLQAIDRRLRAARLPPIHWNAMTGSAKELPVLKQAGFGTTTTYNLTGSGKVGPKDGPIEQYTDFMDAHRRHWSAMGSTTLPHLPVVTMGWDVSPRCQRDVPWPPAAPKGAKDRPYPYMHVVVGNTPERFEQLCREARRHVNPDCHRDTGPKVVVVNAWNEWTEGCYLLPEKKYGDAYLRALRRAFSTAPAVRR